MRKTSTAHFKNPNTGVIVILYNGITEEGL